MVDQLRVFEETMLFDAYDLIGLRDVLRGWAARDRAEAKSVEDLLPADHGYMCFARQRANLAICWELMAHCCDVGIGYERGDTDIQAAATMRGQLTDGVDSEGERRWREEVARELDRRGTAQHNIADLAAAVLVERFGVIARRWGKAKPKEKAA